MFYFDFSTRKKAVFSLTVWSISMPPTLVINYIFQVQMKASVTTLQGFIMWIVYYKHTYFGIPFCVLT